MSEPFIAEIRMAGFNFAPRNWAFCNGQLLSIAQNTALFSLLGTTYGGNGQTTFGLPNLQGSAPMHQGTGPGLSPRSLGEVGGTPNVTLPSPPNWVPSSENRAVFCAIDMSCPLHSAKLRGAKLPANSRISPMKGWDT